MPVEKPWAMRNKHFILVGTASLFVICVLGMFSLILISPSNLSPFLATLSIICLFAAIPILFLYRSAAGLDKILGKLQHEMTGVKISGLLIYTLTCETLKHGKFSLRYRPHIRPVTGEGSRLPESGYYQLWISTAKPLPKSKKIFTTKTGLVTDPKTKILTEKLRAIKSLASITVERIGNENRIVARFSDVRRFSTPDKTSDIIECLKILREVEENMSSTPPAE